MDGLALRRTLEEHREKPAREVFWTVDTMLAHAFRNDDPTQPVLSDLYQLTSVNYDKAWEVI